MVVIHDAKLMKAARVALGLKQDDLAALAGVSKDTVQKLEADASSVRRPLYVKVVAALEFQGIEWLPATGDRGEGFRLVPRVRP